MPCLHERHKVKSQNFAERFPYGVPTGTRIIGALLRCTYIRIRLFQTIRLIDSGDKLVAWSACLTSIIVILAGGACWKRVRVGNPDRCPGQVEVSAGDQLSKTETGGGPVAINQ